MAQAPCGHCAACVDGKTTHCHERSVFRAIPAPAHVRPGPASNPESHSGSGQGSRGGFCRRQSFIGLTTDGGYADYMVCDTSAFVPVPKGFTAVEAASIMCTFGTCTRTGNG